MKWYFCLFLFCLGLTVHAQDTLSNYKTKRLPIKDTIYLNKAGINPSEFSVLDKAGTPIDSISYQINFEKGWVVFPEDALQRHDTITINYLEYPSYLTKDYFLLDPNIISENTGKLDQLYTLGQSNRTVTNSPFAGLNTLGSITRGITIGSNQNAVVNSELDLQITGKLSDKINIRASIQDANIPTQEGGYSQSLDEFDQIFIELYGDKWNIRAGDVDLQNSHTYFGRFTKKVQGISLSGTFDHKDGSKTSAYASGALVRGVFQRSQFQGQEGNQGPYKLVGPNGELFILIVSGSERVYVNGLLLKRGENEDYVIDYNAGEIKFNPTYPINANMRITVEYQFTDQSYTRFIGYGGGEYEAETFKVGAYVYSESDAKNQPLQQSLTEEQVGILSAAGDNLNLMNAPSAVPDTFSENKILYRKEDLNGTEIFVFSNNPEDELFNVRFSLVGDNLGNYIISDESAITRIFEYVAPIDGIPQGNYEPIIRLDAPEKLQLGGVYGSYRPSEKTLVDFELTGSINDVNLFSNIDNGDNDGFGGHFKAKQRLWTTQDTLRVDAFASLDYLHKDFQTIERLYNIEFNRDWNLENPLGDQRFVTSGVELSHPKYGGGRYEFQNLDYSENFEGTRHVLAANTRWNKLQLLLNGSYLDSKGEVLESKFARGQVNAAYSFEKAWVGAKYLAEDNEVKAIANDSLTPLSQRFAAYEVYTGVGDSTKVYGQVGYRYRINDSLRNNRVERVSTSHDYFANARLIQNKNTQLSLFGSYRLLENEDENQEDEKIINTRLLYSQNLWKGGVRLNTAIESNSGVIPQQEFTFVQVEPGQGTFTWIDYNDNGVQELNEFEVAQFQDQAEYVRVLLPNQIFVRIRNNKLSQTVTLNPKSWQNATGFKKFLSHFYNQTSYVIDRKIERTNDIADINPFKGGGDGQLGLTLNFRNALFFNRGKQKYTTSYTYISSSASNLISLGLQENMLESHQLNFNHKFKDFWLANLKATLGNTDSRSENFENRNFDLDTYSLNPKLSYLLNRQTRFDVFYQFLNKENALGAMETLDQQKIGVSFAYNNVQKISISGEFNYIDNAFEGAAFSPVAYTMLEGLQPGVNFTWNLLFQKRITKYLDANLSYFGRKSESSSTIHTGTIQLRAYF
ncbi:hypothetical protein POV27_01155 [Aureisphaera galaxeae]|uniref:hypothetical protein n=1 Tax=Aureisphaera galaxeae TaxID=1538023 RepID=UPI002350412A|nr:hypothetical protein [Aureisphaera galaxeae]MDC8002645.1 hypothetical protein [Aureisphaera galaxeae]